MKSDLIQVFEDMGGEFISPPVLLMKKWSKIKAFIFDWDGVFNTGIKGKNTTSHFTEADSMGVNMLRFSHWLLHRKTLPKTAIITGQSNVSAVHFAEREHFDQVFQGCTDKTSAFKSFLNTHQINAEEVLFVFDDILDIPIAESCGLRIMISRYASPLFFDFVKSQGLADYTTSHQGGEHAVREVCELLIGLNGNYNDVVKRRMAFAGDYSEYLSQRNLSKCQNITNS